MDTSYVSSLTLICFLISILVGMESCTVAATCPSATVAFNVPYFKLLIVIIIITPKKQTKKTKERRKKKKGKKKKRSKKHKL